MALEADCEREPAHAFSAGGCSVAIWPIGAREGAPGAQGEDRHPAPGVPGRPSGTGGSDPGRGAVGRPFVYLHVYDGNGSNIAEALESIGCAPCTLVAIRPAHWNDDMTPWECPGLFAGDAPFAGHAERQLHLLEREIIPRAEALTGGPVAVSARLAAEASVRATAAPARPSPADPVGPGAPNGARPSLAGPGALVAATIAALNDPDEPTELDNRAVETPRWAANPASIAPSTHAASAPHRIIAGYSLAGLFALWAPFNSTAFDRVASASGSLWYPGFARFVRENAMARPPERAFVSLGKKETKTPSRLLRNVAQGTDEVVAALREKGIPTHFALNPGNHFKEPALRMARGIAWCASWPNAARDPADDAPRP